MYDNNYQSSQSISTVKAFFSRTSFLTLTVASAALTLFSIFNTIALTFGNQKNSVISSLYYFFGDNSVIAVNLIVGILVSLLFAFITFGMLNSYLGAIKNDNKQMLKGINIILGSLIYMVILASCLIIISLSSISVTYYSNAFENSSSDNRYYQSQNYLSASSTFFIYVLFGTGIMTLSIALIRLMLSIRRAANNITLNSKGSALALISAIYGASLTGISFIVNLCNLVMPYEYISDSKMLEPASLLILMISVLINAAVTVLLIDLSILISIYSSNVNRINKNSHQNIYSKYATNIYTQTPNRTPYINPVQKTNQFNTQPYPVQTQYNPSPAQNPIPQNNVRTSTQPAQSTQTVSTPQTEQNINENKNVSGKE